MENNSRPIIKFGVGNGLHNQLMSFIDAMVVASLYKEHYDVLLPTMWGDSWNNGENKSQSMRFEEIYDADYLTICMSNYTGIIYREQPKHFTKKNVIYSPDLHGRIVNSNQNIKGFHKALLDMARPYLVVDIGRWYARWQYRFFDSHSFNMRRRVLQCIKPAQTINKLVQKAVRQMHSKFPNHKKIAAHPRLELDWKIHSSQHRFRDGWIHEDELARRLLRIQHNYTTPSAVLLIGEKFNRSRFEQANLTVFTKDDLLKPEDLSGFKYLTSIIAIDYFLALEVDYFYGFMWSSMDVMIYEARLYKCMHTDSIHLMFGDERLQEVSRWTNSFYFYRLDNIACYNRGLCSIKHVPLETTSCDYPSLMTAVSDR